MRAQCRPVGYSMAVFARGGRTSQPRESPWGIVLSRNHPLKKIVEEAKKGSSKWAKTAGPKNAGFYWQAGYGAFSVNQSNVEAVTKYIENQEEHHRKLTFQDELRAGVSLARRQIRASGNGSEK